MWPCAICMYTRNECIHTCIHTCMYTCIYINMITHVRNYAAVRDSSCSNSLLKFLKSRLHSHCLVSLSSIFGIKLTFEILYLSMEARICCATSSSRASSCAVVFCSYIQVCICQYIYIYVYV